MSILTLHIIRRIRYRVLFFNDTATTEIYTYRHTLSLHDSLPIFWLGFSDFLQLLVDDFSIQNSSWFLSRSLCLRHLNVFNESSWCRLFLGTAIDLKTRSEEHTSAIQSLLCIS